MPRPRGPMNRVNEKSKDFLGTMKRLIKNLDKWRYLLVVALLLALASSILAIIAPNKLSDFADIIGDGLVPNTEKLQEVSEQIMTNFYKNLPSIPNITDNELQSSDINISKFKDVIESGYLEEHLSEITIDNVKISADDQVAFLKIMSTMNEEVETEDLLAKMDELPKSIYSLIEPQMDIKAVKSIALLLAIMFTVSSLFSYIEHYAMATISNKFAKRLRTGISDKINKLPLKFFDQHETGDILSIVTNDVDMIGMNMNQSLGLLVGSLTLFLGSIVMMFITNWIMATTAILASLIGFGLMFVLLGKSQKYFNQRQVELGNLNGYIEEMYSGHNVVKSYNGVKEAVEEFNELSNKLYVCNRKSQFLSGIMQPLMMFVGNLSYVSVCIVGALLTMNGNISFGVIVAFMIYVRLFTNPLSQIAQAMTTLQSTAAASERVFAFLDEKEMSLENDKKKHLDKSKVKGEIEFKNVKFGYDAGRTIIKNFSAKALPGQKIAIVGPTGAGKTTMVNLLMKFYEINDGDILIDGVSTKDLTRENIHDLFVMVLQDTWLFDGTIEENIKFNKKDVTKEEIWQACHTVGIDHFIKTLPGGLDSTIGDETSVSQGQKQLLTIARGMIEDAPFLILDEATSNVDTRTEELVQKAMDKLTEGRTSFIIAHRLSTIKNADLILVMNEGNIIEQGTHEELMSQKGFYQKLYDSQFEKIS